MVKIKCIKLPYHDGKDHVFVDTEDVILMISYIYAICPNMTIFKKELIRQLENLEE